MTPLLHLSAVGVALLLPHVPAAVGRWTWARELGGISAEIEEDEAHAAAVGAFREAFPQYVLMSCRGGWRSLTAATSSTLAKTTRERRTGGMSPIARTPPPTAR